MNKISEAQMEEKQINRLAAQRQMYSDAKRIHFYQILLAVPLTIIIFILANIFPDFQKFATYWGIVILLLEIGVLRIFENSLHERAAKIQEQFDCEVLGLPWNDVKCRNYPDPEDIAIYSQKHLHESGNRELLFNWYAPEVDKLPLYLGRIVCQRSNLTWESRLRRRYALGVLTLGILLVLMIFVLGLVRSLTLGDTLLYLVIPLLPAFGWIFPQYKQNMDAAENLDSLKESVDRIWQDAFQRHLSEEELSNKSRQLQDAIYENRLNSPLVFDRIYKLFRKKDDGTMYSGVAELADQALELMK